jgi:hypothetical protein
LMLSSPMEWVHFAAPCCSAILSETPAAGAWVTREVYNPAYAVRAAIVAEAGTRGWEGGLAPKHLAYGRFDVETGRRRGADTLMMAGTAPSEFNLPTKRGEKLARSAQTHGCGFPNCVFTSS